MFSPEVAVAALAWLISALLCYGFLRKAALNFLDPLILAALSIPFSAALLAVLCFTGLVPWDKLILFAVVLCTYLLGARLVSAFFSRESFRKAVGGVFLNIRQNEATTFLIITTLTTLVLAVLGVQANAQGDARQEFGRLFRPLVVFQNGAFLFSLVLLLSPKLPASKATAWAFVLVALSIPFSGKSVLLPLVYWFGLRLFLQERSLSLRVSVGLFLLFILGVGTMGLLAYGVTNLGEVFVLFTERLWLAGDVYIYAYQQDALSSIRASYPVSFLSYMMHPISSLVGVRAYEKPLGAMLSSEVTGENLFTGPNPQLPVLLDFFFPNTFAAPFLNAFIIGGLVLGFRPLGIALSRSRSRYVRLGGIVSAIFCPVAGFLDTSQVLISLVGILVCTLLGITLEIAPVNRRRLHAHFSQAESKQRLSARPPI